MEFIKKNYEKVILSLVLLGLVGVLAFMPVMIGYDQQKMRDLRITVIPRKVEPLPPLDLSRQQAVLNQLKTPYDLDLSTTNKLFNPVQWQRQRDTTMVRAEKLGVQAAVVTKITPLYFTITLDSVRTNESGARYAFTIEDQTAAIPGQRRKRIQYASMGKGNDTVVDKTVGGKNEGFTLVGVKGPPENPDQLVLKLADTGATNTLSKSQPFRRVDAYSVDLKYSFENYSRTGQRVGDHLTFAGDDYNIIAIDKNDVILLAQSNQKKFTLPYAP
jgi:hypothetical protein